MEEELVYLRDLKSGSFLENTSRVIYEVECFENHVILHELDIEGARLPDAKKKKYSREALNGLIRTKHFVNSKTGRRIYFGDIERTLEFDRLTPK